MALPAIKGGGLRRTLVGPGGTRRTQRAMLPALQRMAASWGSVQPMQKPVGARKLSQVAPAPEGDSIALGPGHGQRASFNRAPVMAAPSTRRLSGSTDPFALPRRPSLKAEGDGGARVDPFARPMPGQGPVFEAGRRPSMPRRPSFEARGGRPSVLVPTALPPPGRELGIAPMMPKRPSQSSQEEGRK